MKNLLVSFSGGETSAFMSQWLLKYYKKHGYKNIAFVFANTGEENEETLEFTHKCDKHFGLNLIWVEAKINPLLGKGVRHKEVTFETASRNGEPYKDMIAKHGIPNSENPFCTRDLKERPIANYTKSIFDSYHTAIGIRKDEMDRINPNSKKSGFIYPLINASMIPSSKQVVNFYWQNQSFRLNLKGYHGNCKWCWKKSTPKLIKIAQENPEKFNFPAAMEEKYQTFIPQSRIEKYLKEGKELPNVNRFFRNNLSTQDILTLAKQKDIFIADDSQNVNFQTDLFNHLTNEDILNQNESCEVFTEC